MATRLQREQQAARRRAKTTDTRVIVRESPFDVETLELGDRDPSTGLYSATRPNGKSATVRYRGADSGQGLALTGIILSDGNPGLFSA